MYDKKCSQCDEIFITKNKKKIYCSDYCRNRTKRHRQGKRVYKFHLNKCKYCNKEFYARPKNQIYCSLTCVGLDRKIFIDIPFCLENSSRKIDKNIGYVRIYCPIHPKANTRGYVYEHRLIMEQKLGRYLTSGEHVHHKNRCRWDNNLDNLEIMTASEHAKLTAKEIREAKINGNSTH